MKRILTLLLCVSLLLGTSTLFWASASEQSTAQSTQAQSDEQTQAQTQDTTGYTVSPLTVSYLLTNSSQGFGAGSFYMTLPAQHNATSYAVYWGDAQGNRLSGYTPVLSGPITADFVLVATSDKFTIPQNAKCILAYTYSEAFGECKTPGRFDLGTIKLPSTGKKIAEFVVVSDTHVGRDKIAQTNFVNMLKDVKATAPGAEAIMIVGSAVDAAEDEFYTLFDQLCAKVEGLPPIYRAIGTHEFLEKESYRYSVAAHASNLKKFLDRAQFPNNTKYTAPYYTFFLGGCTMIVLGADSYDNGNAVYSQNQLSWLKAVLATTNPEKPVFVFMHEPLPNTVSGSTDAQGLGEVHNFVEVQTIFEQYENLVIFNGHTHMPIEDYRTMYQFKEGSRVFNTASVAHLWEIGANGGYEIPGSQGYYVTIYENAVMVRGRDFTTGQWIGEAEHLFVAKKPEPVTTAPVTSATTNAQTEAETEEEDGTSIGDLIPPMMILGMMVIIVFILVFRKPTPKNPEQTKGA